MRAERGESLEPSVRGGEKRRGLWNNDELIACVVVRAKWREKRSEACVTGGL